MDLALKYSAKFDIVSPCWFQIKPEVLQDKFNSKIDGADNINTEFMKELKEKSPKTKIMPRFACTEFGTELYAEWLKPENSNHFIKILMRRLKYNKFDGMVLECNQLWIIEETYTHYAMLIKNLHDTLKAAKMKLVLTLFPYSESFINNVNRQRFEYLTNHSDYLNIMAYDYMSYIKNE